MEEGGQPLIGEYNGSIKTFKMELLEQMSLLDVITESLNKTTKAAEMVSELFTMIQTEIQVIQATEDNLYEKYITQDHSMHQNNLKLKGITENLEANAELNVFIANWFALKHQFEEGITPMITSISQC